MKLKIHPKIDMEINGKIYSYKIFESLKILSENNSQRQTAKQLNISHSVLNRRIKKAEKEIGFKLVEVYGSKTYLTNDAKELINTHEKYQYRVVENDKITIAGGHIVTSFLNSIANKLPYEIDVYSSDDVSAYKLAQRGLVDILALDDPQIAFINDLDFIAIGYDYLVLVSDDETQHKRNIKSKEDLKNLKFISVEGTAQRLAWNTFNEINIPFEIVKEVKSEFDAFKIVKNSKNLYTFLNASYFKGNEILKDETKHAISLIPINSEKKEVNELIEYILGEGQILVGNEGFIPIKPWKTKDKDNL
ncbi:LysR family transcriptional regulator [Methanobrevibacter sp. TMH8]|uniref:helix-turn-helix domain-containing protein n=1 Tax=Methanobrevibacter sp. TMH8 TaxID=2848611 RepID=UPI001CCDA1A9|nr:LysR family transcriptional regulator [Methanobrevibacter sp. TMH8]MBZ9570570.1 LysR family transcriptional regulator [Methanobrevibacter sp. TMH8]